MFDSPRAQTLDRAECLHLLRSVTVGRVMTTECAMPAANPVHFTMLDDKAIIFQVAVGGRVDRATADTVVGFQADEVDPDLMCGWSVTVIGHARHVREPDTLCRLSRLPLRSWDPREHRVIWMELDRVVGRRLRDQDTRDHNTAA